MTDWTAGYVADIGYTYGYSTELNPARLALPFLNAGLAAPEITHACELGFGQGLSVNRFQQLFLLALSQGHKQPSDWAAQTWQLLQSQGQPLMKEGQPIAADNDNRAELTRQAENFAQQQLPMLKALGVV